ncbi:MAG: amino acid adenylation domain-containing protein [Candidatus Latescibacterota bacterium]
MLPARPTDPAPTMPFPQPPSPRGGHPDPAAARRFWAEHLAEATASALPLAAPLPAGAGGADPERWAEHPVALDGATLDRLWRSAASHGASGQGCLQAAWALLLSRYTGEGEVVFGVEGRGPAAGDGAAGAPPDLLPLRARVLPDRSLASWIAELDEGVARIREHGEATPAQVRAWAGLPADLPLFESAVVLGSGLAAAASSPASERPVPNLRAAADGCALVLTCGSADPALRLCWDPARLDGALVRRLANHLVLLLQHFAQDLERPVSGLPTLTPEERRQVLGDWNNRAVEYPADACLPGLLAAQVARTPDALAVTCEGEELTYRQLDRQASQLARRLQRLGVGPDVPVGVCLERSLEMVTALVAVLKAGGAYVPLDPEAPAERLAFMLADTGAPVVLTQGALVERLPPHAGTVLALDAVRDSLAQEPTDSPPCAATPDGMAYILYTSGSTGRPKGVVNTHRGICNRLLWMQDVFPLDQSDRVLQKTPFTFDVSVWEFFWPLMVGAPLVVARPGGHRDSDYLTDLIGRAGITTVHFVPSMLEVFLAARDAGRCRSLRRVICSGEALTWELQRRFFAVLPCQLHNLYGPTEAAIDVTHWPCARPGRPGTVPIGRPVANTRIYLLDERGEPVPVGAPGELCIGGVQVARGYLNRPEENAARFLPDPFGPDPAARLYRTGDLARYRQDGNLEFLGRRDFQVKIRGFRVEPGEVESVLRAHGRVQAAAVVARDYGPGDRRLVAYVVPAALDPAPPAPGSPQERQLVDELRRHAAQELPDYMVPSAFVLLAALPLTSSGKLDRRSLPHPTRSRPALAAPFVAPSTELERRLAALWGEVLQVEGVGVHDPFFELGGDSLRAAAFISRLQGALDEFVYIAKVFESPTVAQFAAFLQADYPAAVARWLGTDEAALPAAAPPVAAPVARVDGAMLEAMRRCVPLLPPSPAAHGPDGARNRQAILVLAPPRSGTTLLRVMLAGHPRLFAAAELQLLCFHTLRQRRQAFSGRFSAWLEGTLRAIMELRSGDAEEARRIMQAHEEADLSTRRFYGVLQEWMGDRILVEKTPSYALDPGALRKAEEDFEDPLYIHLVRHPYAVMRSFAKMHMEQILYLHPHPFSGRQLGELVWTLSHANVLDFLAQVPAQRQYRLAYEDLVRRPEEAMVRMCAHLGLPFHPDLLRPYERLERKMVDGLYPESLPMGDTKFLRHGAIRAEMADAWRGVLADDSLGEETWRIAAQLGYARPAGARHHAAPAATGEERAGSRRRDLAAERALRQAHRRALAAAPQEGAGA